MFFMTVLHKEVKLCFSLVLYPPCDKHCVKTDVSGSICLAAQGSNCLASWLILYYLYHKITQSDIHIIERNINQLDCFQS